MYSQPMPPLRDKDQRKLICIQLRAEGLPLPDCAKAVSVHRNTLLNWMRDDLPFGAAMRSAVSARVTNGDETGMVGAGASFAAFRKVYFGFDTYPHQQRMVDAIEFMQPRDIAMVLVFPESGKTTTVTDWVCWKLGTTPNHRITYVSESDGLAKKVAGRIRNRMTNMRDNSLYISKYGPFYKDGQEKEGKPWAQDHFTVNRATHDEADYSFEARAWSSSAYGTRIDTLIIDDVQSRKSLTQTDRIFDNLRATYLSRGRQQRTIIIGTRIGIDDVYDRFEQAGMIHSKKLVRLKAMDDHGDPTAPEMWGYENTETEETVTPRAHLELMRKQVGEETWYASYQQNPKLNSLATFTEQMVEDAKDVTRTCTTKPNDYVVLGLDPALGGGNALMALAFHRDKLTILDLDVEFNLSKVEQILNKIENFARTYRPVEVVIEEAAFQKALVYDDRLQAMGRELGFRVTPHTTTRNKTDPVLGVASMAGSFMRGEVRIPWGDNYARDRMLPLCNQLMSWRPNVLGKNLTQDTVMALWFAWRRWKDFTRQQTDSTGWRRNALPWSPTRIQTGIPSN